MELALIVVAVVAGVVWALGCGLCWMLMAMTGGGASVGDWVSIVIWPVALPVVFLVGLADEAVYEWQERRHVRQQRQGFSQENRRRNE